MFYVQHPQHGRLPIPDMGEVERLKIHGWSLVEPVKAVETPQEPPADSAQPAEVKRRPGRPPKAK